MGFFTFDALATFIIFFFTKKVRRRFFRFWNVVSIGFDDFRNRTRCQSVFLKNGVDKFVQFGFLVFQLFIKASLEFSSLHL